MTSFICSDSADANVLLDNTLEEICKRLLLSYKTMSGDCHSPISNGNMKASPLLDSSLDEEEFTGTSEQESDEDSIRRSNRRRPKDVRHLSEIKEMTMVVNMINIWMDKWNIMSKQIEENNLTIEILLERTEKLRVMEKENEHLKDSVQALRDQLEDKIKIIQGLKHKEERLATLEKSIQFLQKENHELTNKLVECDLIL